MNRNVKRVVVLGCAAAGIIGGSLLFPKLAFAPHAEKSCESKSSKDTKSNKYSSKVTAYVKCPCCGKKIKLKIYVE